MDRSEGGLEPSAKGMKTPNLLEVPKTGLTRREKIKAYKAKHGIETVRSEGCEPPWCALHLPSARKFGYGVTDQSDFMDCVCKVGRLLDESGVMCYGETEREALIALATACHLPYPPT
jgi:hypothetical protein